MIHSTIYTCTIMSYETQDFVQRLYINNKKENCDHFSFLGIIQIQPEAMTCWTPFNASYSPSGQVENTGAHGLTEDRCWNARRL